MQGKLLVKRLLNWFEDSCRISVFPRDRILSAISCDGLNWTREPGIRIDVKGEHQNEMAYYPCVLPMKDGLRMYFYGSLKTDDGWIGRILSAWSTDGLQWTFEDGMRLSHGGPYDRYIAKAPCVIRVDKSYRMYYAGSNNRRDFCILSAVSQDGLSWTKEPDIRLSAETLPSISSVCDPHIMQCETGWRMYFSGTSQGGERIYSASSLDGICWTMEQGVRIDSGQNSMPPIITHPYVVKKDRHSLRMYFRGTANVHMGSCIYSALSEDGLRWTIEPNIRLNFQGRHEQHGVECPCILPLSETKSRMYYTGFYGRYLLHPFIRYPQN